jgi:hypothetical protein
MMDLTVAGIHTMARARLIIVPDRDVIATRRITVTTVTVDERKAPADMGYGLQSF